MVVLFVIGFIFGVAIMCLLHASKEAEMKENIKVTYSTDGNNERVLKLKKPISQNWYYSAEFKENEIDVVEEVLCFFKEYYTKY